MSNQRPTPDAELRIIGYDDCIIGSIERLGQEDILCYDKQKIIGRLMQRDGMSFEEAVDFFNFNILGSWMSDFTPCFLTYAMNAKLSGSEGGKDSI